MKRIASILFLMVLVVVPLNAQRGVQGASQQYSRIQKLLDKQHYADAYAAADSLRKGALACAKKGDADVSRVLLTSTWYMERAALQYQEDVQDSSLARFRAIMPYLDYVDRSLCYLFLGEMDSALMDTVRLREVPNTQIAAFCEQPSKIDIDVTPTMYDLLMHVAMWNGADQTRRVELRRQLVEYYRRKAEDGKWKDTVLLLYNELRYAESRRYLPNTPGKEIRRIYQELLNRYRHVDNPQVAEMYYKLADRCNTDGDYLDALAYCDSAVSRYSYSSGGVECSNLRTGILAPKVEVKLKEFVPAGRDVLCQVETRNVETLYYRLVATPSEPKNWESGDKKRTRLLGCKVLKSWNQKLDVEPDHRWYKHYVYVPALTPGRYTLLASPTADFTKNGFYVRSFTVTAAAFLRTSYPRDIVSGYLVDYLTGKPIANQKVELQERRNYNKDGYTVIATVQTDRQGYYRFDKRMSEDYSRAYRVRTHYKGMDVISDYANDFAKEDTVAKQNEFFLDRPVYRPGDTVQFLFVEGEVRHTRTGSLNVGDSLKVLLTDVNDKAVDSLFGVTDAYGSLSGRLVVPTNALPGRFDLLVYRDIPRPIGHPSKEGTAAASNSKSKYPIVSKMVTVEAYKQPKFTVTLKAQDRKDAEGHSVQPQMGDSLLVDGLTASYTQVPVDGAKVKYSVQRSFLRPWWRRYYYGGSNSMPTVICTDSTTTDAEGHFRIAFVATPDSSLELSTKPCFTYQVSVDVTDINGETHSQQLTLRLGYENSLISITTAGEQTKFDAVEYQYCDLNNTPLQGELTMTVEKLREPETPWLTHTVMGRDVRQTLSESEFHKRYPLTPYSYEETEMVKWEAEKTVFDTRLVCKGLTSNRVPMPRLEAGVYRIRMTCGNVSNEDVVVYTPTTSRKAHSMKLLWYDCSSAKAHVGDTVVLRVGSRQRDVTAIYQLLHENQEMDRQLLKIDDNITTLRIPVTEAMLGGFDICLYAVKEGRSMRERIMVDVPFEHKKLDVEFLTFRDKLTPGDKETWTLKLTRKAKTPWDRTPVSVGDSAAMVMTMYDAALDNYGILDYTYWWPWWVVASDYPKDLYFYVPYSSYGYCDLVFDPTKYRRYQGKDYDSWDFTALNHRNWRWWNNSTRGMVASYGSTARGESGIATKRMAAQKGFVNELAVIEAADDAVTTDLVVVENDAVIDNYAEEVEEEEELAVFSKVDGKPREQPYIRSNLSTLAFFAPTLRTDRDGTITYSFTAPDLLTQWNIKGIAWTQDLAIGTLERTLVTQKQLMIQPNMPRFLREGDTATLMAKVMNLTDSDLTVNVDFSFGIESGKLKIENSADAANNSQLSTFNSQLITVPARGSASVSFPVTVPVGGTVATYKFVARGISPLERGAEGGVCHSDGEQGPLPLLTNRQAVTQSVSMYMNGKGSKQYNMTLPTSSTAQPVSFTVEYTANPIWLAIQSLPYMSDCSNPSNIYLFNSYYVNTLGKAIADQYPELKHCADQATEEDSPLFRNADIRQTLLDETPWLSAGTSEVERLKRIANYYDAYTLKQQTDDAMNKLQKAQRADGSWSWMPEGRYGSTYVTQYILKGFGNLKDLSSQVTKRALAYVDKEAYKDYLEWMEYLKKHPNSQCKPIMLDYLYTRSYYVGRSFSGNTKQAFDYYYGNAKQRYSNYTSLYDQALLALVFHRNGDTKLAREMVTRIKQKALYSDEMGMYWRDNHAGYFYYQRPVETQALLIETFREVMPADTLSVAQMQQWLLKQKQTTRWSSDIATLRAIQSLMPVEGKSYKLKTKMEDAVVVRGKNVTDTLWAPVADGSAGYLRHTYRDDSLALLSGSNTVSATIVRPNKGISWGALYYQYTEQMDKVPASETGITLRRELYRVNPDESLTAVDEAHPLHVGDRFRIRLFVNCDRNLEYVEMKAFRAACLEPVSTSSGWVWGSLHYYVAVNNSHEAIYIDRLEKGKYTIDADYYVTNPGTFTLAPSVLQCLYAPEFRATSSGLRITVQ